MNIVIMNQKKIELYVEDISGSKRFQLKDSYIFF